MRTHQLYLLLLVFLGTSSWSFAQDTIVVQTLTWNDDFRSGTFTFPDDPDQSYRKILMLYNMRCHDQAVGFGDVGCREWDYSCNTFITDPTRLDSNLATAPSHSISGFAGDEFSYTTQTTHTFQQFEQHQTTIVNTLSENEYPIGTDLTTAIELAPAASSGRYQFLYLASELQAAGIQAGDINGLRLFLDGALGTIDFLRIRLKTTDATELNPTNIEQTGFTQVYFQNTDLSDQETDFRFYSPFNWDGSSNLLIDLSFTHAGSSSTNAQLKGSDPQGGIRTLYTNTTDAHLAFNGNGRIYVNDQTLEDVSQEVTVAFWNYGDPDILPANSTAFEARDAQNRRQLNVHLPWSNGQVYWDCGNDGTGYDRINLTANASDFEGQWNHWAFTKNATTGEMRIFLNGELWHSGTDRFRPIDLTDMNIGAAITSSNNHFGKIDEFQLWSKALDQATIQEWMFRSLDDNHPDYDQLVAYFQLNEGTGNQANSVGPNAFQAAIVGSANWQQLRGESLFKDLQASSFQPFLHLIQGEYELSDEVITVTDSFPNPPSMVVTFEVAGTDLIAVDTSFYYPAEDQLVLNEAGEVVSTVPVTPEGSINIGTLEYYQKFDAKYEILSLVTPYGNGLDLGPTGSTFTIDVTPYAPILRGERFMSLEMGGQNQEEMDIKFLFIKGTPERDIIDIQNIWPFRRGWYADIQDNKVFEPRDVALSPEGERFIVRSSITGHGQNGEFVPRYHYISFNEGAQEIEMYVWKECGDNPMYPQGGTWLFDRAGWCPGLPTDIHETDFTIVASPGESINIDYGVNGAFMNEANYLVSNQLVTYGPLNHTLDASIEAVIRPTLQHEYQRRNPACNLPVVLVRNSGAQTINSIQFSYQVEGSSVPLTYTYEGTIFPEITQEITLPVDNSAFWITNEEEKVFNIEIVQVNGAADNYAANNQFTSPFLLPDLYEEDLELQLFIKTNNRAGENAYTISDYAGNVVLSRNNMANATTYEDAINLPPGCYTLEFEDTGDDGLSYWYWDLVDPSVGTGELKVQRLFNNFGVTLHAFETEFGGTLYYDFAIGDLTDVENMEVATLFTVYPNPTQDQLTVELQGFQENDFRIELVDLTGRVIQQRQVRNQQQQHLEELSVQHLAPGLYYVRVVGARQNWVRSFVKQ